MSEAGLIDTEEKSGMDSALCLLNSSEREKKRCKKRKRKD